MPALGIEAVDGLDEAERGDLHEVVERLAAAPVAPCQRPCQRQVLGDQRLPRLTVSLAYTRGERPRAQCVCRRAPVQQLQLGRAPGSVPHGLRAYPVLRDSNHGFPGESPAASDGAQTPVTPLHSSKW